MGLRIREGLRFEEIDGAGVLLDREGAAVHQVTGDAVEALQLLSAGVEAEDVPEHLAGAIDELVASGVVANPAYWTRRRVLLAGGAAWGAATVATFGLSLPAAAQALSMCANGQESTGASTYATPGNHTYNTGPAETALLVRAWGAGGGGGGNRPALYGDRGTGAGGGGGQYSFNPALPVAPCGMYTVVVGAGGAAGGMNETGMTGGASTFNGASVFAANGGPGGANGSGMGTPGGSGGTAGPGGFAHAGGMGGADANDRGGAGGGGASHGGPGGDGADGPSGIGAGNAAPGAPGPGTPSGGTGGSGGGGSAGGPGDAPTAPGGGGGGGGSSTAPGVGGAAGAVWVGL